MKFKKLLPLLVIPALLTGCSDVKSLKPDFEKYEDDVSKEVFLETLLDLDPYDIFDDYLDSNNHVIEDALCETESYSVTTVKGKIANGAKANYSYKASTSQAIKYDDENTAATVTYKMANELEYENINYVGVNKDLYNYEAPVEVGYDSGTFHGSDKYSTTMEAQIQTNSRYVFVLDKETKTGEATSLEEFDEADATVGDATVGEFVSDMISEFTYAVSYAVTRDVINDYAEFYIDNDETLFTLVSEYTDSYYTTTVRDDLGYEYNFNTNYETSISYKVQLDIENYAVAYSFVFETEITDGDGAELTVVEEKHLQYSMKVKNQTVRDLDLDDYDIEYDD